MRLHDTTNILFGFDADYVCGESSVGHLDSCHVVFYFDTLLKTICFEWFAVIRGVIDNL